MPQKRTRRTAAEMVKLRERIVEFLKQQRPASARNLFYRLVQDKAIEKTESAYKNLIKLLVRMRRGGQIPYDYLSDSTRRGYHVAAYRDVTEFMYQRGPFFRWDLWAGSPVRVEIWCEAASLTSVLAPVHQELAVSLFPCRGYSSISFAYEAAMTARRLAPEELVVIYIGDLDDDGRIIDRSLIRELELHVDGQFPVTERRVAVNRDQIEEHNLPTRPDRNGRPTVQAEALPPALLRRLVRDAIVEYLPPGRLERAKLEEKACQDTIRQVGFDLRYGNRFSPHGE